jgi:hypothetical protein
MRGGHNRLDLNGFLERAKRKHGDKFDYSKVEYVSNTTPVTIICPVHGEFQQTPKYHFKCDCPKCAVEKLSKYAQKEKEQLIKEIQQKFNDQYNTSLIEYKNNKTPIKLICKEHGEFEVRPDLLLHLGRGCRECLNKKTKSTHKEVFVEEATKIYGDLHDYSETIIISSRIKPAIRCKKHDIVFEKSISSYLAGSGCPMCSAENYSKIRTKTTEDFIEKARKVHGDRFDYSKAEYKNAREKLTIICEKHGEFEQYPGNHLIHNGCPSCSWEEMTNQGNNYIRDEYIKKSKGRTTYLYIIKCWDENEEFLKIGKTFLSVDKRYTKNNLPYNRETLYLIHGEAGEIYDLEAEIHSTLKEYRYFVKNKFQGHTECYIINFPLDKIFNNERVYNRLYIEKQTTIPEI